MTPHVPEDILACWQAEEGAARARQQTVAGIASPALQAGKTGLQPMQALLFDLST